jgi:hypothetical protein
MTTDNAIRFLHFEAAKCRDRDSCEALCLLMPALLRVMELQPMENVEAAAFRHQFRQELDELPFQDATDRALSTPAVLARSMQPGGSHAPEGTSNHAGVRQRAPGPAPGRLQPAQATR